MQIEDLRVVLKVAEFRSITAAAASLDMQTATASAAIKRVEGALGLELFIRTTRKLRLSTAGERYIPQCAQALMMLEQAKLNTVEELDEVEGELRLSVSSDLGRNVIIPWLDEFMDSYPKLSLRTLISDSVVDFYRDVVDIALRYAPPENSNLYGFKICSAPVLLCASQKYLNTYGNPLHPDELSSHNGLFYELHDITHDTWAFTKDKTNYKIKMKGNRSSNDGDLVRRWCIAGKGLALKSCLDISEDLLSGKLVNVMPQYKPRTIDLWIICPSKQSITSSIRLLREMFREKTNIILKNLAENNIL